MYAVTFQSSSVKLQTNVKVLKENTIYVDAPRDTLTNVLYPSGGYNFSVKFRFVNFIFSATFIKSLALLKFCSIS